MEIIESFFVKMKPVIFRTERNAYRQMQFLFFFFSTPSTSSQFINLTTGFLKQICMASPQLLAHMESLVESSITCGKSEAILKTFRRN